MLRLWDEVWWWFLHATGSDNPSGVEYGFWSGFGSFVPFAVPVSAWYWHHTCHVGKCWRPGKHEYEMNGRTAKLCGRHHPHVSKGLTNADVMAHAEEAKRLGEPISDLLS